MNDDYNPLNNDLLATGVYYKIHDAVFKKKMQHIIMPGSARSSKTHSAMQFIINYILQSKVPLRCAIMRYRVTWLKISTLPDFIKIMSEPRPFGFGIWNSNSYNKTDRVYTFDNGSTLKFAALADDAGRKMAHGFESDILFLNECLDLQWAPVDQLIMRNKKLIIYDFNPGMSEKHWIYTNVSNRPNAITIHSTFRDNPFCPEEEKRSILGYEPTEENIKHGTADETSWKIYGLGIRAEIKGLVYPNGFKVIPNMPKKFDKDGYGLDFGFTNDPTGFVHCGIIDKTLYLDELIYKTELVNLKHLSNTKQRSIEGEFELLKVDRLKKIWADSAEPKSIQDLKNAGYNIDGAKKHGINYSILDGINAVKRFDMYVTERSIHLIKELENYKWKDNSRGESALNTPIDNWNHCIAKGTLITTAKGDIPIEDVKVNDYVLTRKGFRRVTESWCSGKNQYVSRIVTNDSHLDATENHRIFIFGKGFIELKDINIDDCLGMTYKTTGDIVQCSIQNILRNSFKTDVYDLNIEDKHEFFANGILVHNCLDAVRYWCIMSEPDAGFYKESFKLDTIERISGSNAYDVWNIKQGDDSEDD